MGIQCRGIRLLHRATAKDLLSSLVPVNFGPTEWELDVTLEYLHCAPFALSSAMSQICLGIACEFRSRQVNKLLNVEAIKNMS